jgi:hypothetical protein
MRVLHQHSTFLSLHIPGKTPRQNTGYTLTQVNYNIREIRIDFIRELLKISSFYRHFFFLNTLRSIQTKEAKAINYDVYPCNSIQKQIAAKDTHARYQVYTVQPGEDKGRS